MRRAFTLTEVLIVLIIVAVVTTISFPVFASAREQVVKFKCLANERQLGIAMQQYLADWNDDYPTSNSPQPGSSWGLQLYRYVKAEAVYHGAWVTDIGARSLPCASSTGFFPGMPGKTQVATRSCRHRLVVEQAATQASECFHGCGDPQAVVRLPSAAASPPCR